MIKKWISILLYKCNFSKFSFDKKMSKKIANNVYRYNRGGGVITKLLCWRKFNKFKAKHGVTVYPEISLGENFKIVHFQNIIIGSTTIIGDNCVCYQNVSIIARVKNDNKVKNERRHAYIGNNVVIGAGATIIGPITIGDDVFIGANALITKDVPPHSVCYGTNFYRNKERSEINNRFLNNVQVGELNDKI